MPIEDSDELYVGAARSDDHLRTLPTVVGNLKRLCNFEGRRLLDIGCGTGSFTRLLGEGFREVHGIDVQDENLAAFRRGLVQEGGSRFHAHKMSASEMSFPDAYFDTIVSIETFEHISNVHQAAFESARVLRPDGELVVTVPNRFFPFENHGVRIGRWEKHSRIPLLPWIPPLHDRWSLARVFTVRSLDRLFVRHGLRREAVAYLWPTFEHGGNPFQKWLRPAFPLMRLLEHSPIRFFGSSVVVKYRRLGASPAALDHQSVVR